MIGFLLRDPETHQPSPLKASAMEASTDKPEIEGPVGPMRSIKGPISNQLSCQKLADIPEATSQTTKGRAIVLSLHRLFQIQLPLAEASTSLKKLNDNKRRLISTIVKLK